MNASVCPFCNGILPALTNPPRSDKIPCPRCGELVPVARWPIAPADQIRAGEPPPWNGPTVLREPAPGIRKTALAIMGVMVVMAALGLGYMLWTVRERRSRDPQKSGLLEPIALRKPLELSGLGYLPKGCQVVAGLQIAEMMDEKNKEGRVLLQEPRPALVHWVLKQAPRTASLKLEELDHILLALTIEADFPQLVMVVKTRQNYSLEKIVAALRPTKSALYRDKPLYEFSFNPGDALLWCVEERTLVCVVRLDMPSVEHLKNLSEKARPVAELLPAQLRQTLQERLPKHYFAWVAGRFDKLDALKTWLPLLPMKADLQPLQKLKSFALGLETDLTLTGSFEFPDAAGAGKFKSLVEDMKIEGAAQKVQATPAEAKDQWVTWQLRGDPAVLRELLNGGKEAKK